RRRASGAEASTATTTLPPAARRATGSNQRGVAIAWSVARQKRAPAPPRVGGYGIRMGTGPARPGGSGMIDEERVGAAHQKPLSTPRSSLLQLLGYWGVVGAWMLVISLLSTEPFSAANTSRYIDPLLRYFFPHIGGRDLLYAHFLIR